MSLDRLKRILEDVTSGWIPVYRGQDYEGTPYEGYYFFSEDLDFAKEYGKVRKYQINVNNFFDMLNEDDFNYLLSEVGSVKDPYDDEEYDNYNDLVNNISSDTWEITENYLDYLTSKYNGIIIYEGGHRNYIVWNKDYIKE